MRFPNEAGESSDGTCAPEPVEEEPAPAPTVPAACTTDILNETEDVLNSAWGKSK
jgi:hypothetical protein